MNTFKISENTVGEIVSNDFRAAEIFKNAGIDFCCGGNKSISEACLEKGLDPAKIESDLAVLASQAPDQQNNYKEWNLDFLCDYIVNKHHKYVEKTLPVLRFYTHKIADVHGYSHPELIEVEALFERINNELSLHLKKEEEVLFPAIKKALRSPDGTEVSLIRSEIERMKEEHEFAGSSMDKIRELTGSYQVPEDACNTYMVALKTLEQFEDDLHIHVHLENNILYPKALKLGD